MTRTKPTPGEQPEPAGQPTDTVPEDLPVHEGDTPPEGQVRDMATAEDLEEGTDQQEEGDA